MENYPIDSPGSLTMILGNQGGTTPEARRQAQQFIDDYRQSSALPVQQSALERLRGSAEASRELLRQAKEELSAQKYDESGKWFDIAAAMLSPTKTGGFAENAGQALGSLGEHARAKRAFEDSLAQKALTYDQGLSKIDQDLIAQELSLANMGRESEADLAKEGMKVLGRPQPQPGSRATPVEKSKLKREEAKEKSALSIQEALDKNYSQQYLDWTNSGAVDAQKSINELDQAVKSLSKSDAISGPVIGLAPKFVRDVISPESGATQDLIETTAQRSLKTVLGAQFAKVEGEQLLARTFNPRLQEAENIRRATRLRSVLDEAAQNETNKAKYFEQHGTLKGFKGKTDYSSEFNKLNKEFGLRDKQLEKEGKETEGDVEIQMRSIRGPDGTVFQAPYNASPEEIKAIYESDKGYAEGGMVLPEGFALADELPEGFSAERNEISEIEPMSEEAELAAKVVGGAGTGALTGTILDKSEPGDKKLKKAFGKRGVTPTQSVQDYINASAHGMDVNLSDYAGPDVVELREKAMAISGQPGAEELEKTEKRLEDSRGRVTDYVRQNMGGDFYQTEKTMVDSMRAKAAPAYKFIYEQNEAVPIEKIPALKSILSTDDGRKAVKAAIRIHQNKNPDTAVEDVKRWAKKPSLEFLDMVKRGMDQIITKEENLGKTPLGQSMRDLRVKYRDQLDELEPRYKDLRKIYSDDLSLIDSLRSGKDDFNKVSADEFRETFQAMSEPDRGAYRLGVAQHFIDKLEKPEGDINAAKKIISSPGVKKKVGMLFDNPNHRDVFIQTLEAERDMFENDKRTARRVERARSDLGMKGGALQSMPYIHHMPIATQALRIFSLLPDMSKKEADSVLKTLNEKDPKKLEAMAKRLEKRKLLPLKGRGKGALLGGAAAGLYAADQINE